MVHPSPVMQKYSTANIQKFLNDVDRYSIGMDEWFNRFDTLHQTEQNYPPFNLIKESNIEFRLEVACAGFRKGELNVYSESGKLFVEGQTEAEFEEKEYVHRGLAKRSFTRTWTLSDDVEVGDVNFEDGLLKIKLSRVIPEHQKRKVYL